MPRFSIILPCFNAAAGLPETLGSLVAQTEPDWEAICIDDGSRDQTFAILSEAARRDRRIRVLRQANGGPSRARNAGAAIARGDWLAFLDADDLWEPTKLADIGDLAQRSRDAAAFFGRVRFEDASRPGRGVTSSVRPGRQTLDALMGENPVCTLSNLSLRRDVFDRLGGFDPTMRYSEDLEFLIRLVSAGFPLIGVEGLHVRYRASPDGLSANLLHMHEGWRRATRNAAKTQSASARARAEARHLRYLARRALRLDTPGAMAATLALRGLLRAPGAFLGGGYRGPATLACSVAAPLIPKALRRRLFA